MQWQVKRMKTGLTLVCISIIVTSFLTSNSMAQSVPSVRVDSHVASLARDQIRAGHHKRFLKHQQESVLTAPPTSFIFDYPSNNLNSRFNQIFWNEPEGLFAIIDAGKQQHILPGHLLQFFKADEHQRLTPGGSMVVIQTFDKHSYTMILQAHLIPAVNDPVK